MTAACRLCGEILSLPLIVSPQQQGDEWGKRLQAHIADCHPDQLRSIASDVAAFSAWRLFRDVEVNNAGLRSQLEGFRAGIEQLVNPRAEKVSG